MSPEFFAAIRNGVREMHRVAGEPFEWQGGNYTCVAQEAAVDFAALAMGGSNSKSDYMLACNTEHFLTMPSVGKDGVITWRGAEWKIVEVKNTGDPLKLVLHVTKRVK